VASPSPSHVEGVLLLAHELGHAALEHHQPGSLANTEQTERFAMGCELWAAGLLLQNELNNPAGGHSSFDDLEQEVAQWLADREDEFAITHAALAEFEWALYELAQQQCSIHRQAIHGDTEQFEHRIEHLWQQAHQSTGLVAMPWAWAAHPLLLRKPGAAHKYLKAWQAAKHTHQYMLSTRGLAYAA